jgi:UDP-2,3-diacylglucosamine hydrolase
MLNVLNGQKDGQKSWQRLRTPLVLASDVHLRQMDDERALLLLDVISRIEGGVVEYFILNGDIFDFCFGDSRYYQEKYRPLGEALARLAQSGTKVLFIEGNHEFHMQVLAEKDGAWNGVEIISAINHEIKLRDGTKIRIAHGDLIKQDPWYQLFRGLVKSHFAKWCAKRIPGRWLNAYGLRHATVSRAADGYRKLDHQKILSAANVWLGRSDCQHGIFGHFHVPYGEPRLTGEGLILSVDSWEKPNLLVFEQGQFFRIFMTQLGDEYQTHKVEALFS